MATDIDNLALALLRDIRREQADQRTLLLGLVDQVRRLDTRVDNRFLTVEQRVASLRDDLELMIRAEIMGRITHLETVLEDRIEQRLDEERKHQANEPAR